MTGRACCCVSWWDWAVWRSSPQRGIGPIVPGNCTDGNLFEKKPGRALSCPACLLRGEKTWDTQEMREKRLERDGILSSMACVSPASMIE